MASEKKSVAKKANTRKRRIDEIKKVDFSQRRFGLFNKVTELSILCKAKTALIVKSANDELYACGYPNCDAVRQKFMNGKDIMEDDEKHKQEEVVETLKLEYEAIGEKLEELKEEAKKTDITFPSWWNNSVDDMSLESLEEFRNSLETLKLNLRLNLDAKKYA